MWMKMTRLKVQEHKLITPQFAGGEQQRTWLESNALRLCLSLGGLYSRSSELLEHLLVFLGVRVRCSESLHLEHERVVGHLRLSLFVDQVAHILNVRVCHWNERWRSADHS